MWYSAKVLRDENNEITGYWLNGKGMTQPGAKGEHAYIHDNVDHDIDLSKVSVNGETGDLFIEPDQTKIDAAAQEAEIALRVRRIAFGQRLIAIMSIRNDAKELTPSEIVELVATFQTVNTAWLNGSIATSRAIVDAITPDEVLITSADKTAILAEIDANWTALGYEE